MGNAKLIGNSAELELPELPATDGESGWDTGMLLKETGHVTYDPGFVNTAACRSAITYIDGDAGILRYRGYPIEQLAEHSTFLEVSYLLIYGELPTPAELAEFEPTIRRHTMLHEDLRRFFDGFPRDAHPMPVLVSAVSALSTFYQDSPGPVRRRTRSSISTMRLLAKLPTIAAYAYKKSIGQPFLYPDNSLGLVENFLRMTFGVPAEPTTRSTRSSSRRSTCCSSCTPTTSRTARPRRCGWSARRTPTCSPRSRPASTPCSGPLHGGANQAVLEMLEQDPRSDGDVAQDFVSKRQGQGATASRLMGFGHRVYKNYDPRAAIVKATAARRPRPSSAVDDPLLDIAIAARGDRARRRLLRLERKLYPNVDFYTGLIYKAMGFPTADVHGAVRARPAARLDRAVARDDRGPDHEDRPPAAGLRGPDGAEPAGNLGVARGPAPA